MAVRLLEAFSISGTGAPEKYISLV